MLPVTSYHTVSLRGQVLTLRRGRSPSFPLQTAKKGPVQKFYDILGAIHILRHTRGGAFLINIVNLRPLSDTGTDYNPHHASVGRMTCNLSSCLPMHGGL